VDTQTNFQERPEPGYARLIKIIDQMRDTLLAGLTAASVVELESMNRQLSSNLLMVKSGRSLGE